MVERGHQPSHDPLSVGAVDGAGRDFGPIQKIGEGENGVARHHPFHFPSAQAELSARLAAEDTGVRHAAGEHLGQEVGDDRLDPPTLGLRREVGRLGRRHPHPGGRHRPEQIRTLLLRPFQLGEEGARLGECGVVRGRAVAVDRPHAEGAGLAFAGDLLRRFGRLEGEGRHHRLGGNLARRRQGRDHHGGRRKQRVSHHRSSHQRQPAHHMEPHGRDEAAADLRPRTQGSLARRHQPLWSSAYARIISRTSR